jgi:hypothetical protein
VSFCWSRRESCILLLAQEGELYPPCWSRRESSILPVRAGGKTVSSLLEQDGELYPPCWSRRESPDVSFLLE